MNKDELFMARAIDIAQRGSGNVSPNPMVGAVVVHKGKIIGEGWHQQYGEAHAEVRAIEAVVDKSLLKHSTIYVTLEPCAHFGNTPPCASLIIDKEIPNVVIALRDPDPRVNGKGVEMLKDAGLKVTEGVLSTSAYEMNRRFFRSVEKNRPYIILKWAQTKDGFIARQDFSSKWISGPGSRHLVHKWRTEEDAILIGSNTVRYDNPSLNARDWPGKDPLRVVIDRRGLLPADLNLFSDGNPVRYYTMKNRELSNSITSIRLEDMSLKGIMKDLFDQKIRSVLVEGGGELLRNCLDTSQWDEARVFCSTESFGNGIVAPCIPGSPDQKTNISQDRLLIYKNETQWPKN